ncbi:hypothetical protein SO694_00066190 [Aureococcus anophagefferens]|uniref:Uncharacterized protein n=1 Tax=Aureococcus anophagefferens TaxID=44056 RepID=A0ABR1FQ88_AURAN
MDKVERIVEGGALDALVRSTAATRTAALQTVALPLFDGAERTPPPPFAPASVGPAARMAASRGPSCCSTATEDEAASKSLVDLLASARPIEDLGVAEEDRVEAALRKSQRPPPRDVPILLRATRTVALLIFAEGSGGENAWLADICAHGGVPRLLDIVRKDFLLSREGNAENARAAMHLLRLAAKSAIARPALLRALGDVDARFVTTNVDEDALLEHLDIIQDAAAARYAATSGGGEARPRRRRRCVARGDGARAGRRGRGRGVAPRGLRRRGGGEGVQEGEAKKKKARKPPDAAIAGAGSGAGRGRVGAAGRPAGAAARRGGDARGE